MAYDGDRRVRIYADGWSVEHQAGRGEYGHITFADEGTDGTTPDVLLEVALERLRYQGTSTAAVAALEAALADLRGTDQGETGGTGETRAPAKPASPSSAVSGVSGVSDLAALTKAELIALATSRGVPDAVNVNWTKAQIIEALTAAPA